MWQFSASSLSRLQTVDPRLEKIAGRALVLSTIDFGVPRYGGRRTTEEQAHLFDTGKSKCDGVERLSEHQRGMALDFYAYVDGEASWSEHHLTTVAAAFLQAASEYRMRLVWGGHWRNFKDMPHVQLMEV